MKNYYKERIYKEIFQDMICLKFSNQVYIPKDIQCHIISFLSVDDIILMLLKERKLIDNNNTKIIIGKIKNFWYSNHNFMSIYTYSDCENIRKWDIFKTCYSCNYCKPICHNNENHTSEEEYKNGFHLPIPIKNKFTFLCLNCKYGLL